MIVLNESFNLQFVMCLKLLVTRFGSRQMFGFSVCFFFLRFLNGVHESTAPLFAVTAQKSFEFFVNAFPHPVPTGWGMGGGGDKHAGQICLIDRVLLDD